MMDTNLINFLVITIFSFLIGLEVKSYKIQFTENSNNSSFFGSVRTYTFIGILGFVFYKIDTVHLSVYLAGYIALTVMYTLLYYQKLQEKKRSILLFIIMSLVYSFGALIQTQPLWFSALVYVSIVFILNSDKSIHKLLENINTAEIETLGKMILLSVVILPLLPHKNIIAYIPLSPFKIWLAVVVISGISYGGYIIQKYFFPSKGYFLTGIFGGMYSSTATTVVLARKLKKLGTLRVIDAAIISATSMMYLRLIVIAMIFDMAIAKSLMLPFIVLSLIGFLISYFYLQTHSDQQQHPDIVDKNPLELRTAFLFAFLFVIMMVITQYVTKSYGDAGLQLLSFIVGFTDIDPFILSILTGKFDISHAQITTAVMIAAGSNNLLKALYALWFGGVKNSYHSASWISLLGIGSIVWAFL